MEIDWSPLIESLAAANWTAIVVAVVSGGVAIKAPQLLWNRQSERESASVKASLLAEVAALVDIVELRGYLPALRDRQKLLAARQGSVMSGFSNITESYEVDIDSQFNRVYQGNVTKLGVLAADDAREIVRFHQLADSVRLDVVPGGRLAVGTNDPNEFGKTADLLEMALRIGHALTDSIANEPGK
jgi:hypothetical protein